MKIGSRLLLEEDKKNKGFQKVTLKMVLLVGEAKNNSVIGPLLGQHQINIMSFCNEFNNKSQQIYVSGVPLRIKVKLKKDRTYEILFNSPELLFFLDQILISKVGNVKNFSITEFYDVVKIFSFFLKKDLYSTLYLILGYLTSSSKKYKFNFIR